MDKFATITHRFATVEYANQWIQFTKAKNPERYFEFSELYTDNAVSYARIAVDCKTYRYKWGHFYDYDILLKE